ncbi:DUF2306 domain-containing protein [Actinoplanes missouriensis]|uniref:DUF2306 domain-containing protein n=1 Tax=Actinoplanes missouriensis TaxID=1866 RepID=UPI0033E226A0
MRKRAVWAMLVAAVVAGPALIYPYLTLDAADSRLEVSAGVHYAVLVAHIFTAAVALVLGPLQFVPRVRARRRLHRLLGRTYLLAGVVPAAVTAIPVAVWSGRALTRVSLTVAAMLWLVTAGMAYRAARRGRFTEHRDWMTRNYALTFLAVTSRMVVPLMMVATGSTRENVAQMIPIGQTLGWIINLAVAEVIIRRRRSDLTAAGRTPARSFRP